MHSTNSIFSALRAESIDVENTTEYSFPSQEEIMSLSLPNDTLANISLPSSLLAKRASGEYTKEIHTCAN